jgi:hypothetical protein
MNKFDMNPYRERIIYDENKIMEMFNLVENMNTNDLLIFSTKNKIPLSLPSTKSGDTLIHVILRIDDSNITEKSKLNMCKFLILHNVPHDLPNRDNISPLHIACQLQLESIIKLLLENNADINRQDNIGNTPMHYLLGGIIKNYEIREVVNIIPPKKKNNKLDDIYIEIKKYMSEYLKTNNLTILETLKETFNNIVEYDNNINDTISDIMSKQKDILSIVPASNDINLIYKIIMDKIKRTIIDTVQIKPLDDLQLILNPTSDDLIYDNKFGIIKNGANIKREIKKEIQKNIDLIENLTIREINQNDTREDYILINDKIEENNTFQDFQYLYNEYKHPDAFDNASPIINFKKLIFTGGSRNLEIIKSIKSSSIEIPSITSTTITLKQKILLKALDIDVDINDNFTLNKDGTNIPLDFLLNKIDSNIIDNLFDTPYNFQNNIHNNISKYNINLFSCYKQKIYKMYLSPYINKIASLKDYMTLEGNIISEFLRIFTNIMFLFIKDYGLFNKSKKDILTYYKQKHEAYKNNLIIILDIIVKIYDFFEKNKSLYKQPQQQQQQPPQQQQQPPPPTPLGKSGKLEILLNGIKRINFNKCNEYQLSNIIVENLKNIFNYLHDDYIFYEVFNSNDSFIMNSLHKIFDIFNSDLKYYKTHNARNENNFNFFNLFMKSYMFLFRLNYEKLIVKILDMYDDSKQAEWLFTSFSMVNCLSSYNNLEGNINDTTLMLIGALGSFDNYVFENRFDDILSRYINIYNKFVKIEKTVHVNTIIDADNNINIIEFNKNPYYKNLFMNLVYLYNTNDASKLNDKTYSINTEQDLPSSSKKVYEIENNDIWKNENYRDLLKLISNNINFIDNNKLKTYFNNQKNFFYLENYNIDDEIFSNVNIKTKIINYFSLILETLYQGFDIIFNYFDKLGNKNYNINIIFSDIFNLIQNNYNYNYNYNKDEILEKLFSFAANIIWIIYDPYSFKGNINKIANYTIKSTDNFYKNISDLINATKTNEDTKLILFFNNLLKIMTFDLYPKSDITIEDNSIKSCIALLISLPELDVMIDNTYKSINNYYAIFNDTTLYNHVNNDDAYARGLINGTLNIENFFTLKIVLFLDELIHNLIPKAGDIDTLTQAIIINLSTYNSNIISLFNIIRKEITDKMRVRYVENLPVAPYDNIFYYALFQFMITSKILIDSKNLFEQFTRDTLIIKNSIILSNSLISVKNGGIFNANNLKLVFGNQQQQQQQQQQQNKMFISKISGFSSILMYSIFDNKDFDNFDKELYTKIYHTACVTSDFMYDYINENKYISSIFNDEMNLINNCINIFKNFTFDKHTQLWNQSYRTGAQAAPLNVLEQRIKDFHINLIDSIVNFLLTVRNNHEEVVNQIFKNLSEPEIEYKIDLLLIIILKIIKLQRRTPILEVLFNLLGKVSKIYRSHNFGGVGLRGSNVLSGLYGADNNNNWNTWLPLNNLQGLNIHFIMCYCNNIDNQIYINDNYENSQSICENSLSNLPYYNNNNNTHKRIRQYLRTRALFLRACQNTLYFSQSIEIFFNNPDFITNHINDCIDNAINTIIMHPTNQIQQISPRFNVTNLHIQFSIITIICFIIQNPNSIVNANFHIINVAPIIDATIAGGGGVVTIAQVNNAATNIAAGPSSVVIQNANMFVTNLMGVLLTNPVFTPIAGAAGGNIDVAVNGAGAGNIPDAVFLILSSITNNPPDQNTINFIQANVGFPILNTINNVLTTINIAFTSAIDYINPAVINIDNFKTDGLGQNVPGVPANPIVPLRIYNQLLNFLKPYIENNTSIMYLFYKTISEDMVELLSNESASLVLNSIKLISENPGMLVIDALLETLTTSVSTAATLGVILNIPDCFDIIRNEFKSHNNLNDIINKAMETAITRFYSSELYFSGGITGPIVADKERIKNLLSFNMDEKPKSNIYKLRRQINRNISGNSRDFDLLKLKYAISYNIYKLNPGNLESLIKKVEKELAIVDPALK